MFDLKEEDQDRGGGTQLEIVSHCIAEELIYGSNPKEDGLLISSLLLLSSFSQVKFS